MAVGGARWVQPRGAASIGVPRLTVAKILNHAEQGVTAVYDRHSYDREKREALDAWAKPPPVPTSTPRRHLGHHLLRYSELCHGVANSARPEQNQAALAEFVAPLEVCDYPADASTAYGRIRAELRRRGKPIGPLDMLIAAHAVHLGVVLVTNDMTEFQRVSSLRVESWV